MSGFDVKPLSTKTWPDFACLVERHDGVWGGCWCIIFHLQRNWKATPAQRRAEKQRRVREGRAHAALVYDGPRCIGWCQFGPITELPSIKLEQMYLEGLKRLPDWRITCFFVDREYRHRGVASTALKGALREIARLGGGTVESYPQDVEGHATSGSFLYNATTSMFERQGFRRGRQLGKNHYVLTKVVRKAPGAAKR